MGACFTAQTVKAKDEKELRAKFRELVEEAQYMHGHGGYTGTFAEKDGEGTYYLCGYCSC
jgi:hypothetical protein